MSPNESQTDRIIRVIAGLILGGGALVTSGPVQTILGVLAAIALFTAATGFCLIYKLLGITTLHPKEKNNSPE